MDNALYRKLLTLSESWRQDSTDTGSAKAAADLDKLIHSYMID